MKMRVSLQQLPHSSATRLYLRRISAALRLLGLQDGDGAAGLYQCEPFDPDRRTIVMIHGLGGDALAWSRLTEAIEQCPQLHARFQVWHVVYNSNAPTLVIRRRAQAYLDETWQRLDPEGRAAARSGMVLIGHSLGGVVARMLCVDSGDALWSAAFTVDPRAFPVHTLAAAPQVPDVFRFERYPGVGRAIFLAAPHRGSPNADNWLGRLARILVGDRTTEIRVLRTLVREHPEMVREELRATYQQGRLNSISTLQVSQPVRRAGEALMPGHDIPYHVIAGALPGIDPPGDGVVPLSSALLPGAASTLVMHAGHNLYDNGDAVNEILRILREDVADRPAL